MIHIKDEWEKMVKMKTLPKRRWTTKNIKRKGEHFATETWFANRNWKEETDE